MNRRYHTDADLIALFKSHILSYIEYRTPAIAHASASVLAPLDAIQGRFLRNIGVSDLDALLHFNLAPLHTRRDIAALGVIHRAALGGGPAQLRRMFPRSAPHLRPALRHCLQVEDLALGLEQDYVKRSFFGRVRVYNLLPPEMVDTLPPVQRFQSALQTVLKSEAAVGTVLWPDMYRS